MKKKVATTISARYYLRNFLPKTLYQRSLGHRRRQIGSLGHCRKEVRSLGYRRKEVRSLGHRRREARSLGHRRREARSLGHCRRQMRSLKPRSRGVTLSWGVPLAITISSRGLIDLLLLTTNKQVLTSKSYLI